MWLTVLTVFTTGSLVIILLDLSGFFDLDRWVLLILFSFMFYVSHSNVITRHVCIYGYVPLVSAAPDV